MNNTKPFHRNYRPVKSNRKDSGYSSWAYIINHDYCENPEHYTRGFLIIQEDLIKLFEYIEPSEINRNTYSFRTHELLLRICIEIEANFKAIFKENIYNPVIKRGLNKGKKRTEKTWKIEDFKLINKTHHLDDYEIELPFWKGEGRIRKPFLAWKNNESLTWYQAYNKSKHDRINSFHLANLDNLLDAYSGLLALLSSQFYTVSFRPSEDVIPTDYIADFKYFQGKFGIGNYSMVKFPTNWSEDEKYNFDWCDLKSTENKFEKINYNNL